MSSHSSHKRRSRRQSRRLGRKKYRQNERRILRGDRARGSHYSMSWSGGPRADSLPLP